MNFDQALTLAQQLAYRDKLRLAQVLIQLARKEEEEATPDNRATSEETTPSDPRTANGADPGAEGKLPFFRDYLKAGHGRGRLHSEATIYQGKAGYFCVSKTGAQEVLLFCCMPHEDILLASAQQVPPA